VRSDLVLVVAALAACSAKPIPPVTSVTAVAAVPRRVPPVASQTKIPCARLIDVAAFTSALAEPTPLAILDDTRREPDATASCALVRGGPRPSEAELDAIVKKQGRLSVLPGDVVCEITAYCWTIEDADHFHQSCARRHDRDDNSMGSYACVRVVAMGVDDINVYRFLARNGCIVQVRGGPANVDNAQILSCAKVARDTIGDAQIATPR
jgi:hypothetical protein